MIRSLLIALLFACAASVAQAQLRIIPAEAKRGTMSHVEGMIVELDGKRVELAAGCQIRDGHNMIVVPTGLPKNILVRYLGGADGKVHRVWVLSPQEAAQPDPKN
jgi:hypothetical protein